MSVLKVKNGDQWDIVPAIKGDTGDPAADESITDDMLVTDGIKTEIKWLWGNQLMDSSEGEILHAEDAYTAPAVDISIDGKSTQVTTTGKNLLNPDFSYWTSYNLPDIGTRKGILIPVNTGTYNYHNLSNIDMMYGWVDDADNVESTYIDGANITQHLNAGTQIVADGTHPFILICTYTGTPQQNVYDRQPMLEYGATNTGYEPYTGGKASPNPDYPQEIVSLEHVNLGFYGRNLLNPNEIYNGYITSSGGVYGSTDYYKHSGYLRVFPNVTYRVSQEGRDFADSIYTAFYDENKAFLTSRIQRGFTAPTFMAPDNAAYMRSSFYGPDASKAMIEVDRGTYEGFAPYSVQSVLLNLTQPLRSLPDGTKDELHLSYLRPSTREGWAWYSRELVREIDKCGDGTPFYVSTIGLQSDDTVSFIVVHADLINHIKQHPISNIAISGGPVTSRIAVASHIYMRFPQSVVGTTVASIKSYLDEHCVLLYRTATPTTETLDPIELPIMPSQTVNVWSDPATNLKMTYIQDSNLIIENLEATIADIATS